MRAIWLMALLVLAPAVARAADAGCGDTALLIPGKRALYQRIITRPGATIAPQAGPAGQRPAAGFDVFYVYCRQGEWIQVGRSTTGRTEGWVPSAKAIEWKNAMVGEFTNPANRQPLLFLDTELNERNLLIQPDLGAAANRLHADIRAGRPGPVVAQSPNTWVDILQQWYLLPILSARTIEREVDPFSVRLLEVISAPDTASTEQPPADPLAGYKASVVFLIDTTLSMQPYIEATRDMIRQVVTEIGTTRLKDKFRFGLVAYRDSLKDSPLLEYDTKIFSKPDFNEPPDAIMPRIAELKQSTVSSQGFDEDPIGGLNKTLNEIDWSAVAGRYVVLITDAGARDGSHPNTMTGKNIGDIKADADGGNRQVAISVVHLLTPAGAAVRNHEKARRQYEALSYDKSSGGSSYYPVPNGAPDAFRSTVGGVVNGILASVARATGVPAPALRMPANLTQQQQARLDIVNEAMKLAYLGRVERTRAPDVVRSFTTDHDLLHPEVPSLNICVLLTKNQLSDLAKALTDILTTGRAGRIEPQAFFARLRQVFAAAATDPQQIARIGRTTSLGGLLSEYVDDLPYTSTIMGITEQEWLSWGTIKQDEVLNDIEGKLRAYRNFQEHPDWFKDVTHSGSDGDKVAPVPLDRMP